MYFNASTSACSMERWRGLSIHPSIHFICIRQHGPHHNRGTRQKTREKRTVQKTNSAKSNSAITSNLTTIKNTNFFVVFLFLSRCHAFKMSHGWTCFCDDIRTLYRATWRGRWHHTSRHCGSEVPRPIDIARMYIGIICQSSRRRKPRLRRNPAPQRRSLAGTERASYRSSTEHRRLIDSAPALIGRFSRDARPAIWPD